MNQVNRRAFLKNAAMAGAATVGGAWLAACGDEKPTQSQPAPPPPAPAEPAPAAPPPAPADPQAAAGAPPAGTAPAGDGPNCTDVSALSEQDKTMRTTLAYVDRTTVAGKDCKGCQLFVATPDANGCGTCTVVKGPISPMGYCNSWVAKV